MRKTNGYNTSWKAICCWILWSGLGANASAGENDLLLYYDEPAEIWEEALPIGNGQLGAMIYGGTEEERIQFNETSLYTGEPRDYSRPGAHESLDEIRRLLFEDQQVEAEKLAMEAFMSEPLRKMSYQPFADVILNFPGHQSAKGSRAIHHGTQVVLLSSQQIQIPTRICTPGRPAMRRGNEIFGSSAKAVESS